MSKCAVENGKMYDIKLGTCDMPLDETDQFYKTVISKNAFPLIYMSYRLYMGYRGVTHQSITIGFGLRHIRLSHLVLGLHTLDYHTWSRPRTH